MTVRFETDDNIAIVTIDRPEVKNAVDRLTAQALTEAFTAFEEDDELDLAILYGANGVFCAGADLKAKRDPNGGRALRLEPDGDGPLGPTRMLLTKPTIAAVEGFAVAGGLELAAWCDLRVAANDAVFGVFCRRWSIPLMDGGTIRLSRLLGHSHALDLILTGRGVSGDEAVRMGLANRLVPKGDALSGAKALARQILSNPQAALRTDRLSSYEQWSNDLPGALLREYELGIEVQKTDDMRHGLEYFASGKWRAATR